MKTAVSSVSIISNVYALIYYVFPWCLFICSYFPYRATSSSELFITLPGMGRRGEWGRRCGRGRLGGTAPAYAREDHGNHKNHDQGSRPWELNPRSTECQTGVLTTRPPRLGKGRMFNLPPFLGSLQTHNNPFFSFKCLYDNFKKMHAQLKCTILEKFSVNDVNILQNSISFAVALGKVVFLIKIRGS